MSLVQLKAFSNSDIGGIFESTLEDGVIGFLPRNSMQLFSAHLSSLRNSVFLEFSSVYINDDCNGCIYAYSYKPEDLHAKIKLESKTLSEEESVEAIRGFLLYLFSRYPLKKVFYETTDVQLASQVLVKLGFTQELILESSHYIHGKYTDLYVYGCYKDDFCYERLSSL